MKSFTTGKAVISWKSNLSGHRFFSTYVSSVRLCAFGCSPHERLQVNDTAIGREMTRVVARRSKCSRGRFRAGTEGSIPEKMETPGLTDAVAGGACEVGWTWLSAGGQGQEAICWKRECPLVFIQWSSKTFLRVSIQHRD